MGRPARAGESPVSENRSIPARIQSTAGHVKPGGKLGGPPSNPKYYSMTDRGGDEVLFVERSGELLYGASLRC